MLTDYGRLAEFVPDLQASRVISRDGNQAVVEQKGEARLLFFSFPIDVRLAVTEYPYERVVSRAVAGNFREMRSAYSLEAGQGRVALRYSGRMVPGFLRSAAHRHAGAAAQRRDDLSRPGGRDRAAAGAAG